MKLSFRVVFTGWSVIFMGYGSGLIVGLVIGTTLTLRYYEWFVETFGRRKKM
ncbi:hypothetical protein RHMOL_Rhmol05G0316900 [Rhododendron molle]|uniref:Uncharacterized protein n=1 Tax=Rhododendron molle TaxID=49168 RepID=A0ACC0NX69_RHOML|nr:hypothetical protein RHMOL_Rhmol05G0316900 [Rhododendron molle]